MFSSCEIVRLERCAKGVIPGCRIESSLVSVGGGNKWAVNRRDIRVECGTTTTGIV